jgi:hypothetical protein
MPDQLTRTNDPRVRRPRGRGAAAATVAATYALARFTFPLTFAGRETSPVAVGAIQFISYEQVL